MNTRNVDCNNLKTDKFKELLNEKGFEYTVKSNNNSENSSTFIVQYDKFHTLIEICTEVDATFSF